MIDLMVIWFLNVELTMVAWFNLTIWPWSAMVQPWSKHCQTIVNHGWQCSSPRDVLIWMSAHQVFQTIIDHQVIWFLNVELTMVAWINLTMVNHGSTMVKTLPRPWSTMVQPCSSPRGVLIWMSAHQVFDHDWPSGHSIFECGTDHGWPWSDHGQTMVAWYNLTMVNHGSTMVKTLPDHGQPWLTMVRPCSSRRGVLIWMSAHQVFDHDWPWSFDFWMWNWPWLTMVRPWLPDITWPWSTMVQPWSKHCQTMVNHGSAMFIPQRYVDLNVDKSGIWPWFRPCHLISECGTDHGWPWSDHGCLTMVNHGRQWWLFNRTMVNHGSTMVKTLPDHGQPWSLTMVQPWSLTMVQPWFNHGWSWSDHVHPTGIIKLFQECKISQVKLFSLDFLFSFFCLSPQ